jgi:hypothetical protein
MMAYTSANAGKGVVLFEKFQSLVIFALIDECNITLNTHVGRTGSLAGGGACFGNTESSGYCLWILFKDGFTFGKTFIIFVGKGNGADLHAFAAACAFGKVYETGFLVYFRNEVSGLAFEIQKFSIG